MNNTVRAPAFVRVIGLGALVLVSVGHIGACKKHQQPNKPPETPAVFLGDTLPPLDNHGEAKVGGTLRVAIEAEPPSLNSQLDPLDYWGKKFGQLMYSSMAAPNPHTWQAEGLLAESWELADDNKTLTFHLRKDVQWHDGKPFTARDVVFTFAKILDPSSKTAAFRSHLEPLERFEQLDAHTVRFFLKRPYWYAFDAIAEVLIYPEHIYKDGDFNTHPANRKPIGTGPYRFVRWKSGDEIVLARNANYFSKDNYIESLVFKVVTEPAIRLQMLRRGELDVIERLSPELWKQIADDQTIAENYWRLRQVPSSLQWVGWNMGRPLFADKRVRRAMTMLLDRRDIVDNLRLGLDDIAVSWFYPGAKEHNSSLKPLAYDPKAAMALLKQAGWEDRDGDGIIDKDGQPFVFTFSYPAGNPFYEQLAGLMQSDFKRAGIKVETARLEWAVFMERLRRHEFDACSLLWQLQPRNDPYQVWHSSAMNGGSNFVSFQNNEADKLLEDARSEFDDNKRQAMYQEFSKILHDEQPYTMLFHRYNLSLVSKRYGRVFSTPYGILRYHYFFEREALPEAAATSPIDLAAP